MPRPPKQGIIINILSAIVLGGLVFTMGTPAIVDITNEPPVTLNTEVKVFELPKPELEHSRLAPTPKDQDPDSSKLPDGVKIENIIEEAQQIIEEVKKLTQPKEERKYISQEKIYNDSLDKVVNLLCNGVKQEVIVVTGFLISEKGHILTNAHASDPLEEKICQVRQGSPAKTFAIAERVFQPQSYARALKENDLQARAENDISIWKITKSSGKDPLPEKFPHFKIDKNEKIDIGDFAVTLSYPSELLGFETILRNLTLLFTQTKVIDMDNTFILTKDTLSSQSGSSGGALVSQFSGQPIGIIFGVEKDKEIAERTLFSLSTRAIEKIVEKETRLPLETFLLTN